jgi:2-polyprenyl-6-methoxyphenol hydroxylase-like FAD-dependent oxidoreductase
VIVVGAGPTGLMLAGELALAGVAIEVIERQAVPSGQSRGGGINPRTSEVLAMRGLLDAANQRAVRRESAGGHFAGLPLLVGLACDDAGVEVTVSGGRGESVLWGSYLVACDGGHSTVRKLIGMDFPGRAGTLAAVSADVELAAMSTTVPRSVSHISTLTRTGGGYWMLMHPLEEAGESTGLYRVVFGGPEQETLPRQAPVTANEVIRALTAVHGAETKLKTLRWGSRFSDATRQVSAYRCGRILFGGDAAHVHSPIGGQGVNLGIQDAMNLGWKLAAHIQDRAPDGLLDSYHTERHPVGARVLAMTRAQTVLMSPPPEADGVRALREIIITLARLPDANRYLARLMSGLDLRYDFGDSDPLVGARMVDLSLETEDGLTTVSTLLRSGHGVLLQLGGPASYPTPTPDGVDRVIARVVDSPVGVALGASPGADRVLIRPDGYVCWAGAGPDSSPASALHPWFGRPAGPGRSVGSGGDEGAVP